jgi:ribonucleoside-diphosphate reductase alpha chain
VDGDEVPVADAQFRAGVNVREDLVDAGAARARRRGAAGARRRPSSAQRRAPFAAMQNQEDAPPCSTCGSIMVRSGSCYKCANCGTTSGCA